MGVGSIEVNFARDVGYADAVPVPGDAAHHSLKQAPTLGVVRRAEPEGVQQRDGPGAHGQDVAHYAAHASGGALQRFHRGRVVMGFDLENHRQAVADVHRPGSLSSGEGQHPWGAAGEEAQ